MIRFALATFLVTSTLVSATPALSQQDLEQPSASGGLGNTRADLDRVYGEVGRTNVSDLGDYAIASASYEDEWVFYLIADGTAPSPDDRAIIIHRYADVWNSWNYPEAIEVANRLLPADVVPTGDLVPNDINGVTIEYRQTFYSESIARLISNPEVYSGGDPGSVWLVLTLDYSSSDPSNHFVDVNVRIDQP